MILSAGIDNCRKIYILVEPDRDSISGTPVTQENWDIDELYNWNQWTKDSQTENRAHNLANELTARDSQNLTYDGKGNLTDDGTYEYEWDKFNRLIKVSSDSTLLAEYIYDAGNRRVAKKVYNGGGSTTTEYVLSANWQVLEEYIDGTLEKTYVYGLYIDEPILVEDSLGDKYYYCHDAQYSVTVMLDDAGDIAERYEYTPYGKTDVCTDSGTDGNWFTDDDEYAAANEIGNPYRYTGRRFDAESGMYYFRNRMWSGEMGRFVSRDIAEYADGLNFYAGLFVLNYLDPYGTFSCPHECKPGEKRNCKVDRVHITMSKPDLEELALEITGALELVQALDKVGGIITGAAANAAEFGVETAEYLAFAESVAGKIEEKLPGMPSPTDIVKRAFEILNSSYHNKKIYVYLKWEECIQSRCYLFCKEEKWEEVDNEDDPYLCDPSLVPGYDPPRTTGEERFYFWNEDVFKMLGICVRQALSRGGCK